MTETWAVPPGYKSLKVLTALVLTVLAIAVLADVAAAISDLAERDLVDRVLGGGSVTLEDLTASDDRQRMVGTIQLAALGLAGAFFIIWFVTARRNVESFGAVGLRYGPGWAIGGWFVPIAALFIPKQIMDETWKASDPSLPVDDRSSWQSARVSPLIHIWWAFWILSAIVLTWGRTNEGTSLEGLRNATTINIVGDVMAVIAGLLAITVVSRLSKRQEERARQLGVPKETATV